jgi:hypothetical protein
VRQGVVSDGSVLLAIVVDGDGHVFEVLVPWVGFDVSFGRDQVGTFVVRVTKLGFIGLATHGLHPCVGIANGDDGHDSVQWAVLVFSNMVLLGLHPVLATIRNGGMFSPRVSK